MVSERVECTSNSMQGLNKAHEICICSITRHHFESFQSRSIEPWNLYVCQFVTVCPLWHVIAQVSASHNSTHCRSKHQRSSHMHCCNHPCHIAFRGYNRVHVQQNWPDCITEYPIICSILPAKEIQTSLAASKFVQMPSGKEPVADDQRHNAQTKRSNGMPPPAQHTLAQ